METIFQIITALGSSATAIAVFFLFRQIKSQKQELIITNFSTISNQIDDIKAKNCRRILYNSHDDIQRLVTNYLNKSSDRELDNLNEVAKYTAGIYEKVGFLLEQDKHMKSLIIKNHGFTIARLWKIIEPLHVEWKRKDHVLDYTGFKELGEKSLEEFKEPTDIFIKENYNKSQKLDKDTLDSLFKNILNLSFIKNDKDMSPE